MEKSEQESLIIKRDGLLKLRRVIDVIDKLRQIYPENDIQFRTTLNKFVDALKIYDFNDISALLRKAESLNIGKFIIYNDGDEGWGSNTVSVIISNNFEETSKKIRSEYHKINDLIPRGKQSDYTFEKKLKQESKTTKDDNLWKLTHPVYWICRIFLFFKKYPLVFLALIILLLLVFIFGWQLKSFNFFGIEIVPDNE